MRVVAVAVAVAVNGETPLSPECPPPGRKKTVRGEERGDFERDKKCRDAETLALWHATLWCTFQVHPTFF